MKMGKGLYLLLFYNLIFITSKTTYEGIDTLTPHLLYEYAKQNYLLPNNKDNYANINYMIIDPENYLKSADLSKIKNKMQLLYDRFNLSSYIILISHLQLNNDEKTSNISDEIERFTSYFNYMLYKNEQFYNDNMALITVFFIKERKMRMRTGRLVKEIITDDEALNILRNRKKNLRRGNYYKVIDKLIDDIYQVYEDTFIYHKNVLDKNIGTIFFYIIFFIVICVCKLRDRIVNMFNIIETLIIYMNSNLKLIKKYIIF